MELVEINCHKILHNIKKISNRVTRNQKNVGINDWTVFPELLINDFVLDYIICACVYLYIK